MWITGKEGFEEDLWCTSLEWTRWWYKELPAKSVSLTMATCTAYFMSSYWKLWDLNPGSHDDEWHEAFVDPFCIWSSWVHKEYKWQTTCWYRETKVTTTIHMVALYFISNTVISVPATLP